MNKRRRFKAKRRRRVNYLLAQYWQYRRAIADLVAWGPQEPFTEDDQTLLVDRGLIRFPLKFIVND